MKPYAQMIYFVAVTVVTTTLKMEKVGGSNPMTRELLQPVYRSNEKNSDGIQIRQRRDAIQPTEDTATLTDTLSQQDAALCNQHSTSLRGRDGRDGRDGKDGELGQKGEVGETGAKGDRGLKGDTGSPGQNATNPGSVGTTYVRWGRSLCPSSSQLVYEGVVGGNYYTHTGGAANYLCLPHDPDQADTGGGAVGIYSTEYETSSFAPFSHLNNHDVPCAVCRVSGRGTMLMIPAKASCQLSWTTEYVGYLMAANTGHAHQTEFICVDNDAEARPGTGGSNDGALLYGVHPTCGDNGLPCLPYVSGNIFKCVVCTI